MTPKTKTELTTFDIDYQLQKKEFQLAERDQRFLYHLRSLIFDKLKLTDDNVKDLSAVSHISLDYPHELLKNIRKIY